MPLTPVFININFPYTHKRLSSEPQEGKLHMHTHEKNPDIEALRACAILFVLASHLLYFTRDLLADTLPHLQLWQGVDLFFVISGYLISNSLRTTVYNFKNGLPWVSHLKTFGIRRAFRLFPAAWLWIFVPVIIAVIWPNHPLVGSVDTVLRDAFAALTNTANFYWAYCIGTVHWGEFCSRAGILGVYWSLSQEEQFYLLLPLALFFISARALVPLLIFAILILLIVERPVFSLGWYVRPDGLLWGVLLATWKECLESKERFNQILTPSIKRLALATLIIALALAHALLESFKIGVSTIGFVSIICAALVGLCMSGQSVISQGYTGRVLSWLGSRSYALYLLHWPAYCIIRIILFPQNLTEQPKILASIAFILTWCFICTALAEITFRYIETPCRLYGRKIANNRYPEAHQPQAKSTMGHPVVKQ